MNTITMKLQTDNLIEKALKEDISSDLIPGVSIIDEFLSHT